MTIPSDEITAMRTELGKLLPDSCIILTAGSATPNGAGEVSVSWAASGTVTCRLDPIKGREEIAGGAVDPYQRMRLTLPYNAGVTEANRVRIGGVDYNVVGIIFGNSWALDLRAEVERL
jgi:head-tail adaptor